MHHASPALYPLGCNIPGFHSLGGSTSVLRPLGGSTSGLRPLVGWEHSGLLCCELTQLLMVNSGEAPLVAVMDVSTFVDVFGECISALWLLWHPRTIVLGIGCLLTGPGSFSRAWMSGVVSHRRR